MPETPNYLNLMKHVLGRFDEAAAGQLTFGQQMEKDMQFVEADVRSLEEAPGKQEARLVSELMVTKGMSKEQSFKEAGTDRMLRYVFTIWNGTCRMHRISSRPVGTPLLQYEQSGWKLNELIAALLLFSCFSMLHKGSRTDTKFP